MNMPTEQQHFLASARYAELLEQRKLTPEQWQELDELGEALSEYEVEHGMAIRSNFIVKFW